jgi:hypothetical protein
VKFSVTPAFESDFRALPVEHQKMFRERVTSFSQGCDAWAVNGPSPHPWPSNLRVHQLTGTNVWSMTWHYRRPDGRATFEFVQVNDEPTVMWRRIGGHDIYEEA